MASSSSRKPWSRISSTRSPGLLSGEWGRGTHFVGLRLPRSFDFRQLSSRATSDGRFLPAGGPPCRGGRKRVFEAQAAAPFCAGTRGALRGFSCLQLLAALYQHCLHPSFQLLHVGAQTRLCSLPAQQLRKRTPEAATRLPLLYHLLCSAWRSALSSALTAHPFISELLRTRRVPSPEVTERLLCPARGWELGRPGGAEGTAPLPLMRFQKSVRQEKLTIP